VSLRRARQSGVTLMEMLIVVTIIGVMVGVAFPSITAGLETLRLRSASDSIVSSLNSALNLADRRQTPVEIRIDKEANRLTMASAVPGYQREVVLSDGVVIEKIHPAIPQLDEREPRVFLVHPGGTVPRIGIEIRNRKNARRLVMVDPITGVAQVREMAP